MRAKSLFLILGIMAVGAVADARDDRLRLPIADVLNGPLARSQLDPGVQLYFGKQPYANPANRLGPTHTNKKTNFFNKTDQEGCNWAFLSAIKALQAYARKIGGNAVVNIASNYQNIPFVSETHYECGAGNVVGGVAFTGEVVLIK